MSAVNNILAVFKGEKDFSDAIRDMAKDGGTAAATGYVMSGGLTVLAQSLSSKTSTIIQSLVKSNVPGKIISGIMQFGSVLKNYASGEINTQEFLIQMGDRGLNFASMSYGMVAGQSLIPIPIVGAAIGGLVASALTSDLIQNFMQQLKRKDLEHQERLRIIRECKLATEQERNFRAELEYYLANYFRECRECFDEALSGMNLALQNNNADSFIQNANKITRKLGGDVYFETVDEFVDAWDNGVVDRF